jgi:hypothetical protein
LSVKNWIGYRGGRPLGKLLQTTDLVELLRHRTQRIDLSAIIAVLDRLPLAAICTSCLLHSYYVFHFSQDSLLAMHKRGHDIELVADVLDVRQVTDIVRDARAFGLFGCCWVLGFVEFCEPDGVIVELV